MSYPICHVCGSEMTEFDGCWWYTCPKCSARTRVNENGSYSTDDEVFRTGTKKHYSDFSLADFCRGGDLSED